MSEVAEITIKGYKGLQKWDTKLSDDYTNWRIRHLKSVQLKHDHMIAFGKEM